MTIKGDMAGIACSKTGLDYAKCREVIEAALSICTDHEFVWRFAQEADHSIDPVYEYREVIKFLQRMV